VARASTSTFQPPCEGLTIVVVDDDETFRIGLAENLRQDGHTVFDRSSPAAVENTVLDRTHLVVTDYQMEPLDGLRFADRVRTRRPAMPVLLVTAYATSDLEAEIGRRPWMRLCRKPLDYDDLHDAVHKLGRDGA
jgi:DNA-binding NtrC family response regulator